MATLTPVPALDKLDAFIARCRHADPLPFEHDTAWWASLDAPPVQTDGLAWLVSVGNESHPESSDPSGARALAGSAVLDVVADVRFHRSPTIAAYLDSPHTRPTVAALVKLTVPSPGHRVSGFAAALDDVAREWLALGTLAGRLAAWAVEDVAHEVEWYGSGSLREWELDRAAFAAAVADFDALCSEGR